MPPRRERGGRAGGAAAKAKRTGAAAAGEDEEEVVVSLAAASSSSSSSVAAEGRSSVRDAVARRSAPRGTPVKSCFFSWLRGGEVEVEKRRRKKKKHRSRRRRPSKNILALTEPVLRRLVEVRDGAARGHVEVESLGGAGGKGLSCLDGEGRERGKMRKGIRWIHRGASKTAAKEKTPSNLFTLSLPLFSGSIYREEVESYLQGEAHGGWKCACR